MKLIAHRGNWKGRIQELENSLFLLDSAICAGFDVEVDVWKVDNGLFLGHDGPEISVSAGIIQLLAPYAWFHAKNYCALEFLLKEGHHVFTHDGDDYTITSKGFVWAYPGKPIGPLGVACMPEAASGFVVPAEAYGVCSDNLLPYVK